MKTKLKYFGLLIGLLLITVNVSAKEKPYYTNHNGVEMNETEYKNVLKINGLESLDNLTQDMFDEYLDFYSSPNLKIETISNDNFYDLIPYSQTHDTNYKKLKISTITSQTSSKMIVVRLEWKAIPNVKSYDVMGVRLYNTSFQSSISNLMLFDGVNKTIDGSKQFSNGYGASIKIPDNCSTILLQQSFKVAPGGRVYASYQHAIRNISLADSTNFSISDNGLGSVFAFGNNNLFDKMAGVDITI